MRVVTPPSATQEPRSAHRSPRSANVQVELKGRTLYNQAHASSRFQILRALPSILETLQTIHVLFPSPWCGRLYGTPPHHYSDLLNL